LSVITPLLCNSLSRFSLSAIERRATVATELGVVVSALYIGVAPGEGASFDAGVDLWLTMDQQNCWQVGIPRIAFGFILLAYTSAFGIYLSIVNPRSAHTASQHYHSRDTCFNNLFQCMLFAK